MPFDARFVPCLAPSAAAVLHGAGARTVLKLPQVMRASQRHWTLAATGGVVAMVLMAAAALRGNRWDAAARSWLQDTPKPGAVALLMLALAQVAAALGKPMRSRSRWIQAWVGSQIRLIPVDDVLFVQSDAKYTRAVTCEGESLIRKALKDLLDEIDPQQFWQIHRGTVVNSRAIGHLLREDDRLTVVLRDHPERLEVSRRHAHLFRSM